LPDIAIVLLIFTPKSNFQYCFIIIIQSHNFSTNIMQSKKKAIKIAIKAKRGS